MAVLEPGSLIYICYELDNIKQVPQISVFNALTLMCSQMAWEAGSNIDFDDRTREGPKILHF